MSMSQEDTLAILSERVGMLEDGFKRDRTRQDAVSKEVKVILAEIHIITEWIHQTFGKQYLIFHYNFYAFSPKITFSVLLLFFFMQLANKSVQKKKKS